MGIVFHLDTAKKFWTETERGWGDGKGFTGSLARRNEVLKKFRHWSPTLRWWSPKFRHTGCLIQQPLHFSFFPKDMVCVISFQVHVKLFLPKGRIRQNTRSELTRMTNTCMHTNNYNGVSEEAREAGVHRHPDICFLVGVQLHSYWLELLWFT